jgi:hypothetical protein
MIAKNSSSLSLPSSELEAERIRKLKLENDETAGLTMLRADHDKIMGSHFLALRNFFERGIAKTRQHRAMRSAEELIAIDYDFVHTMMEAYGGAPVEAPKK